MFIHAGSDFGVEQTEYARELVRRGYGTFSVDLSAFGDEVGKMVEVREKRVREALTAFDELFVQPRVDPTAIFVVGEADGGYIAAAVAAQRPLAGVVLRAPALYAEGGAGVVKADAPYIEYRQEVAPDWQNQALAALRDSQVPVLVVSSEHDELIPRNAVMSYLAAATGPKAHRLLAGAGHRLDARARSEFASILREWLDMRLTQPALG
jgi:pimeloyl-ACP methyl ester carboxylesterase